MAVTPGLYEQVVTAGLEEDLENLDPELQALLARITGNDKLEKQIAACNRLIETAAAGIDGDGLFFAPHYFLQNSEIFLAR